MKEDGTESEARDTSFARLLVVDLEMWLHANSLASERI
jgi:hypothetical protein